MKKLLLSTLAILALSGAVLFAHPNSAAAEPPDSVYLGLVSNDGLRSTPVFSAARGSSQGPSPR